MQRLWQGGMNEGMCRLREKIQQDTKNMGYKTMFPMS